MLCMNNYSQQYVDECRASIEAQVATYHHLVVVATDLAGPAGATTLDAAVEAFEPVFFNNMVLALENYFVHRSRAIEGKDGNPLNEVRVLANSLMGNAGRFAGEKTIRLKPATSLLKYDEGDRINLREGDFLMLSKAFFAELESKFV